MSPVLAGPRAAGLFAGAGGQAADPELAEALAAVLPPDLPDEAVAPRLPQLLAAAGSRLRAAATLRDDPLLPDPTPGAVTPLGRQTAHAGHFEVQRLRLAHRRHDGAVTPPLTRELFVMGDAVVVLPWDPVRDRVLVIDQFRVGPWARGETQPWMVETVAGRIDAGETPTAAAVREAAEEAGLVLDPSRLIAGPHHYPSPGAVSEYLWLYVAPVDLPDGAAGYGGLESEGEDIRGHLIPRAALGARARAGALPNGPLALLALWLEVEAPRLRAEVAARGQGG